MSPFQYFKILVLLSFLLLSSSEVVFAAPSHVISPLVIDIKAVPRDITTRKVTITNTGTQPITVYPTVNNVSTKDGGTIEEFLTPVESDRTTSLASWLEFSRRGIDIKQGETKTLEVTLRVHPEPVPGTYHAFLGFATGDNRDQAERTVREGGALGTMITVTIEQKKNEVLKLSQFFVDRFLLGKNDSPATLVFKNPGDETVVPTGEVIIYDSTGAEVKALSLNTEKVAIEPGKEHTFSIPIEQSGLFGKYKAYLSVDYGTSQRASLQDTSFFYALPLKTLLIVTGAILIFILGISWYVHKKYFDEDAIDDSEYLTFKVRTSQSEAKDHDIDLKKNETSI